MVDRQSGLGRYFSLSFFVKNIGGVSFLVADASYFRLGWVKLSLDLSYRG